VALAALESGQMALAWRSDRAGRDDIWFGIPGVCEDINPPPYVSQIEHSPSPNPDDTSIITFRASARMR